MNIQEYEEKLRALSSDEFRKFREDFGGGQKTIDECIREFVDHPEYERRICQLLKLKTEAEKLTDAAINSASASMNSAKSARSSMRLSIIASLAALIAAIAAIFELFKK